MHAGLILSAAVLKSRIFWNTQAQNEPKTMFSFKINKMNLTSRFLWSSHEG